MSDSPQLLTLTEAAAQLRISRWLLYDQIREKRIRTVKIGARRLVPVAAIAEYVALLMREEAA
jgi:excisionase family DNA binding protein